jgi:hypothetical protein
MPVQQLKQTTKNETGSKDILSAHIGPNRPKICLVSQPFHLSSEQQLKKEPDKRRKG